MTKYHAKKAPCHHNHTHDSKKEALRCDILHEMEQRGEISDLRVQVKIELLPSYRYHKVDPRMENERGLRYIADFQYTQLREGKAVAVIEDVKGMKTPEYIIKRKLVKWLFCKSGDCIFMET